MSNVIEVPHKAQKPWADADVPGWWHHAYGCIRVDCPKCGEIEGMAYWIGRGQVLEDGTVTVGPKTCNKCELSGNLRLLDFNIEHFKENK